MMLPRPPRRFVAEDILAGRVDLTSYPFRYIFLTIPDGPVRQHGHAGLLARVDVVFTAVELLETVGWEFLHIAEAGQVAYMRRTGFPPGVPASLGQQPGAQGAGRYFEPQP